MFKFAFDIEVDNDHPFCNENSDKILALLQTPSNEENETKKEPTEWYEAERVPISKETLENLDVYKLNAMPLCISDLAIPHIVPGFLLEQITSNVEDNKDIAKAEQTHSDLIPGIYEGGAKIWECTEDLLQYLAKNIDPRSWRGKRVLDLGCGAGLLGIYAYRCGATVQFQDYNKDVLAQITIPNVILNVADEKSAIDEFHSTYTTEPEVQTIDIDSLEDSVQFYSGDWRKYSELTSNGVDYNTNTFDYILTSETIYNPKNQQKLLDTFFAKLSTHGIVLVAAKTYYFGVGGGLRQFEALVAADKRFRYKIVWTSTGGVGREILELRLKE